MNGKKVIEGESMKNAALGTQLAAVIFLTAALGAFTRSASSTPQTAENTIEANDETHIAKRRLRNAVRTIRPIRLSPRSLC